MLKRAIYLVVVLFATLVITVGLLSPTFDQVLKELARQKCMEEIAANPKVAHLPPGDQKSILDQCIKNTIDSQGLDDPWYSPKRLYSTIASVMALDLGRTANTYESSSGTNNIHDLIMERLPRTVLLFGSATAIVSVIGIYLGAYIAGKEGGIWDKINSAMTVTSTSFPVFWVGIIMILVFAFWLRLLPAESIPRTLPSDPYYIPDLLYHMILPLVTLVMMGVGSWAYTVRYFVLHTLSEDFITAKRTAGIPEKKILYSHALRNAAPPVFTSVALGLAGSFAGAVLIETVFDWPGMGMLYLEAIGKFDIPVLIGLTYISTLIFVITIFIIDLAYGYLDPRVKVSGDVSGG